LKEEGERITEREVEAGKTAEQVVDAVMDAEETKGRLARVEGQMAESAAEQRAALESAKKELMEDISAVNECDPPPSLSLHPPLCSSPILSWHETGETRTETPFNGRVCDKK
jgi:hypothetical protein